MTFPLLVEICIIFATVGMVGAHMFDLFYRKTLTIL
jgi:hypothetical protein